MGAALAVNDANRVIGQDHPRASLTDHEVDLIVELREGGMLLRELAEKFDISVSSVFDYVKGRRRAQAVVGHRLPGRRRDRCQARPARLDEFEVCA